MPVWLERARGYAAGVVRGQARGGVRILCYHGVVERKTDHRLERNFHLLADFQKQVEFLRRRRTIAVSDLEEELGKDGKREAPAAMITFDDGFANNLLAAEVLERARLPWSIFVTTGAIEDAEVLWPSGIALLLLHGNSGQVAAFDTVFSLRTRSEREQAYQVIRTRLKAVEASLRVRAIAELRAQFPSGETARLQECFPSMRMLRWSELGQLSAGGVEVGSHGVSHELHHAAQSESVRMRELGDSKAELERRLGRECRAFAFPNGTHHGSSRDEVKRAGYRWAFTTEPRPAGRDSDWMLLPRFDPPSSPRSFMRLFFNSRY